MRFENTKSSPPMRFQARDGEILKVIYRNDGVLGRRHLKSLFWPKASDQAMEHRLYLLHRNYYLGWPSAKHRRTKPIPEPVVWLGWKGALWVAGQFGYHVKPPLNGGENQLRKLEIRMRNVGIRWMREPRWIQLAHDLAVVDFRLSTEKSIDEIPALSLGEWVPEGEFRSQTDVIEIMIKGRDGSSRKQKKGVCPDSYFEIINEKLIQENKPAKARFLLELDNATHPNCRFGLEKILPGVAYIRSSQYKERFGYNAGQWLVVTTGEVRLKNLMQQTKSKARDDSKLFFFTTLDEVINNNVFSSPIWHQVGDSGPKPLIIE